MYMAKNNEVFYPYITFVVLIYLVSFNSSFTLHPLFFAVSVADEEISA